jgi:hypothetical protein
VGCNCGGANKQAQVWVYQYRGEQKVYNTEVEARAAQIRNGGGNITARAK